VIATSPPCLVLPCLALPCLWLLPSASLLPQVDAASFSCEYSSLSNAHPAGAVTETAVSSSSDSPAYISLPRRPPNRTIAESRLKSLQPFRRRQQLQHSSDAQNSPGPPPARDSPLSYRFLVVTLCALSLSYAFLSGTTPSHSASTGFSRGFVLIFQITPQSRGSSDRTHRPVLSLMIARQTRTC
jgi:hypothetical protein